MRNRPHIKPPIVFELCVTPHVSDFVFRTLGCRGMGSAPDQGDEQNDFDVFSDRLLRLAAETARRNRLVATNNQNSQYPRRLRVVLECRRCGR